MKRLIWRSTIVACLVVGVSFIAAQAAVAGSAACDNRVNNTQNKLQECVTIDGVREHQAALQSIADANNGIRTSGTPGYDASVDYVVQRMTAAGYQVTVQPFDYQTFITLSPTVLEQVSPPPAGPIVNNIMSYSGSGDTTAAVSTLSVITGCDAVGLRRISGRKHRADQSRRLQLCAQGNQRF